MIQKCDTLRRNSQEVSNNIEKNCFLACSMSKVFCINMFEIYLNYYLFTHRMKKYTCYIFNFIKDKINCIVVQ